MLNFSFCRGAISRAPLLLAVLGVLLSPTVAISSIRVVSYNTANSAGSRSAPRETAFNNTVNGQTLNGAADILRAIGDSNRPGFADRVDILLLQESNGTATTAQGFANLLNDMYGLTDVYKAGVLQGSTLGAGRPTVVYNSAEVELVGERRLGTLQAGNGQARQTLRYQFRPVGYDSTADFYVYNSHYRAGSSSDSQNGRNVEANVVRNDATALNVANGENDFIHAGDLNLSRSSEAAYQTLTTGGNSESRFEDPLNRPGNWSNNSAFKDIHTQSPSTTSTFPGQTTGGMDDRFDFQLVSSDLNDAEGLSIIQNSYWAFGNTDAHQLDGNIDSPGIGTAVALEQFLDNYDTTGSGSQGSAVTLLDNLRTSSDHLPVVADYQLPSIQVVDIELPTGPVITGADVDVEVTIGNGASLNNDELDSDYFGTGALSGSGSVMVNPQGSSVVDLLFDTSSVGMQFGDVFVNATSEEAGNPNFMESVELTVLDHSNASFDSILDLDTLDLDFGTVISGEMAALSFDIFNLASVFGTSFTAGLDFDSFSEVDPDDAFSNDLSLFTALSADSSQSFNVMLTALNPGFYTGSLSLFLSDEDLPGATGGQSLLVNYSALVQAIPEPTSILLVVLGMLGVSVVRLGSKKRLGLCHSI